MRVSVKWCAAALIVAAALVTAACSSGGIGMSPGMSGARWGSGAAGPDVFVGGGPALP